MIADRVHFVTLEVVEAKLVGLGCSQVESPLPEHQFWKTPWGHHFFVPVMLGNTLLAFQYHLILDEIEKSRPTNH